MGDTSLTCKAIGDDLLYIDAASSPGTVTAFDLNIIFCGRLSYFNVKFKFN